MQSRNTITVTVYGRNTEYQWAFPARWIICPRCDGHATTTEHIECDGGGFTSEEWAEACDEDEDFAENYFSGAYDRPCPCCEGRGSIQAIDEDAIDRGGWRDAIMYKAHLKWEREEAEYRAMCAAERRRGA
jgi:RecJ-like exonuclease